MTGLADSRGTLTVDKEYPAERDVVGEEPRVGVFVCHCGSNIAGVIDVESVAEYAMQLPGVAFATDTMYTCSSDSLSLIRETIEEHDLNRVVVASCTPRTHEPIFQDTLREAGLNPFLFEMANIRDQASWVHAKEPEKATAQGQGPDPHVAWPGRACSSRCTRSTCRSRTPPSSSAAASPA